MGLIAGLRRLDDRVLGQPKPDSLATLRTTFCVALLGFVAFLVFVLVTGRTSALAGAGGFIGISITSGARWYRATRRGEA